MTNAWAAFLLAFGTVFVAELGDKTQFVVFGLGSRGRPWMVWLGASAAFLLLSAAAVLAGGLLAAWIPRQALLVVAGLLFLVFGVWSLRSKDDEAEAASRRSGFLPAFALILVAELGDKTQIGMAALATQGHPVATGLGGFLALSLSALLAAVAGTWLARHVPAYLMHRVGAATFLLLGAVFLILAAWP